MVISRRSTRRIGKQTSTSARRVPIPERSPPASPVSFRSDEISPESIHSPYYLTNGDNPGLSIISESLDGSNYDNWSIAMKIALDAKNKLAFIDGSIVRPDESHRNFRIWSRCNSMVKSWILNTVSKQIYKSILRFNDAAEIWTDLLTRFHITNLSRSYQLSQQIWSLQQGPLDLATYYTSLKTLWDELDGASCITTCHHCDCCKAMETKANHSKVIKFLAGLNESYAVIRSQIIMKKTLPELSEIYNLLDQDHNQRNIMHVHNASAFHVSAPAPVSPQINVAQSGFQPKQTRPVCAHCGYNGHTVDTCYKIHGYPASFKHKTKPSTEKQSSNKPVTSAKPLVAQLALSDSASDVVKNLTKDQIEGVIAYFSSQLSSQAPQVNNCIASSSGGSITALPGMAFSSSTLCFVGMLQGTNNALCSESWIIDSGATHHVAHDRRLFVDLSDAMNTSVTLPTGFGVKIEGIGCIRLSDTLVLSNVLYIPNFRILPRE
ncbi:uncharacterized protein LOC130497579 [Raphanus sativus]|uniref:Uncharacterized protein LOC130497579 n=1 Tax=Raphanus sativus TaxID=3726 RepID=A0A9W3C4E9_RAPSA|nr:uncharacterized protein LOC130497579 [Raphanus sativus]